MKPGCRARVELNLAQGGVLVEDVDAAVAALVSGPGGPPGAIALVDRAGQVVVHTAGTGEVGTPALVVYRPCSTSAWSACRLEVAFA